MTSPLPRHCSYAKRWPQIMKTTIFIILSNLFSFNCLFSQTNIDTFKLITFNYDPIMVPYDYNCDTCLLSINMQPDKYIIKVVAPSNCDEIIGNTQKNKDTLKLFASLKPDKIDTS